MVLLAPAFRFVARWQEMQGPSGIARWRDTGWLDVLHYGDRAMRRIHFGLIGDAGHFPGFPDFQQPALIFHGVNDAIVPVDLSREFARSHPNACLRAVESDHELLDVLDSVTAEAVPYLTT